MKITYIEIEATAEELKSSSTISETLRDAMFAVANKLSSACESERSEENEKLEEGE